MVAYTGTADNDTTVGWWKAGAGNPSDARQKEYAAKYLNVSAAKNIHWTCIRTVMASAADTAVYPLQDVLGIDTRARMNLPGSFGGANWRWRYTSAHLVEDAANQLREMTETYGRLPIR